MAVTSQGAVGVSADTVAIPAHQPGDLIIITARRASNTPATTPAAGGTVPTWADLQSAGANTLSLKTSYTVATAAGHTSGTWTNAEQLCCIVLRSTAPGGSLAVGASSTGNGNNTQTIVYPALALQAANGVSFGVRCGTRTVADTEVANAPASWDNRSLAGNLLAIHTRAALAADPTADTVNTTGSNAAYRAHTVEVRELFIRSRPLAAPNQTILAM